MARKRNPVKRENWKGTYVYVARNKKGQFQQKIKVKDSKTNIKKLRRLYKKNNTFRKDIIKKRERLKNVSETTIARERKKEFKPKEDQDLNDYLETRKKPPKAPNKKRLQYFVEGTYNGEVITSRSMTLGEGLAQDKQEMKRRAWVGFLRRLDQTITGNYDENEGYKKLENVKNIREGWVYYE